MSGFLQGTSVLAEHAGRARHEEGQKGTRACCYTHVVLSNMSEY